MEEPLNKTRHMKFNVFEDIQRYKKILNMSEDIQDTISFNVYFKI